MQISIIVAVEKAFSVRFFVGEASHSKNIGEFCDLISLRMQK